MVSAATLLAGGRATTNARAAVGWGRGGSGYAGCVSVRLRVRVLGRVQRIVTG